MAKLIETVTPEEIKVKIELSIKEVQLLAKVMGKVSEGYDLYEFLDDLAKRFR